MKTEASLWAHAINGRASTSSLYLLTPPEVSVARQLQNEARGNYGAQLHLRQWCITQAARDDLEHKVSTALRRFRQYNRSANSAFTFLIDSGIRARGNLFTLQNKRKACLRRRNLEPRRL